ncbi:isoaspartyl peptidase/L-asparaginase [Pyrodictium abyssi]|uniref:Plant-type L-asparaginase n=1 Tax=Pyrodictium abyssi TaxID=54256 RepID=A0ABM8IYP7_9CREN|nr:isoaspartyl peptidase/L-asparaginase family protein [Pyrodictium abyssi]
MAHVTVYGPVRLGDPAVIVHGGAGGWRGVSSVDEVLQAVRAGAIAGLRHAGEGLLTALVEAVAALEDSGVLNAGVGSVLTYDGRVEMDAGVMTDSLEAGGVAVVSYPRNPVRLAAYVAEKLPHVLLAGPAADELAQRLGLERHPGPSPRALERWRTLRERLRDGEGPEWARVLHQLYGDTVGAVVLVSGRLAASASTGGLALKHPGRVGDSPVPGAGFYVERRVGGCSATGVGETILLGRPCVYAVELLAEGVPVEEAARAAVARHTRLFGPDNLGIILLDARGNAAAAMNTQGMPIALAGREKPEVEPLILWRSGGGAER